MVRKISFLLAILLLPVLGGGCLPILRDTMTMSISLTWTSDDPGSYADCDVGIWEPGDSTKYWVTNGRSRNGIFSVNDMRYGGPETWTLNPYHANGLYTPLARSNDCFGRIRIAVTVNDVTAYGYETVTPGYWYYFMDYHIIRSPAGNTLQYNLVREKAPPEPEAQDDGPLGAE